MRRYVASLSGARASLACTPRARGFFWRSHRDEQLRALEQTVADLQTSLSTQKSEASTEPLPQLALLIDADNTSARALDPIMAEVSKYGQAGARRIYGDWTTTQLQSWKTRLQGYAITPVQQFANTVGKNATDSAMIIDAMDLMHSQRYEVFCLP